MNREILRKLKESENIRVRTIAALVINADISFLEAEKRLNAMFDEGKYPTGLQRQYEADMNAEFNC
jgi:hypothetical protein